MLRQWTFVLGLALTLLGPPPTFSGQSHSSRRCASTRRTPRRRAGKPAFRPAATFRALSARPSPTRSSRKPAPRTAATSPYRRKAATVRSTCKARRFRACQVSRSSLPSRDRDNVQARHVRLSNGPADFRTGCHRKIVTSLAADRSAREAILERQAISRSSIVTGARPLADPRVAPAVHSSATARRIE